MPQHTVRSFDEELSDLGSRIQEMGTLAEHQYAAAVDALIRKDKGQAELALKSDLRLDAYEREISSKALSLLALRQPVAVDFRDAVTAVKIASDLERIGDLSKGLARRATALAVPVQPTPSLRSMTALVATHVHEVICAYVERDAERALAVWANDREVDDWFYTLYRELLSYMLEDPRRIGSCTHLLFAGKSIERIGDHCANIADSIYYLVEGSPVPVRRPKGRDVTVDADVQPKA